MILDVPWDVSIVELDDHLCAAGIEPLRRRDVLSVHDLNGETRTALVMALRESVRRAWASVPPIEQWLPASQSLFMNDDGTQAARQRQAAFWLSVTQIVNGSLALVMLGDLAEIPFFIELLKHRPAGHLIEMAADVLYHYVDPSHELDMEQLLRRAEDWWRDFLSTKNTKEHEGFE